MELSMETRIGTIKYESDLSPRVVYWREIGTATILQNASTGVIEFAFDSDTWEGWIPHLDGYTLDVKCNFGGVLIED